jgi:nucleoside-diphosphate-sugar epimerase
MKIAITGITGFVGQNLSSYLASFDIQGISRHAKGKNIGYEQLSLAIFNNQKAFVHLAGKAHDLKKTSDDQEYYDANTELTKELFNQFLESTCETFVYMSSVKAAADEVVGFLTEQELPNPVTVYGKSKLAAEAYILSKQLTGNKRVYILRPCMIHGPNNKGNLNLLYNFVSKGIPYPFGQYKNQRSFVSVANLCFIIKELIENNAIASGIYNISDDQTLSTKELVQIIGKTIGKPAKLLNVPKAIINVIAKIGDIIWLPINSERVQKLTENYCVSNKKIKRAIGKELPYTAEEGIIKTIESFLKLEK